MSKVEITLRTNGTGSCVVDGNDVSNAIAGLEISSRVGRTARLTLDLPVLETYVTGEMDVMIPDRTVDLLMAAGWTPPDRPALVELAPTDQ